MIWIWQHLELKVHPKLAFHSFTAHHFTDIGSGEILFWSFTNGKKFQAMDACGSKGLQRKNNRTQTLKCLHTARVVSSKCLQDAAVDSKRPLSSLLARSAFMWARTRTKHSCRCLHAPGSCWAFGGFKNRGGVLTVLQSHWSCRARQSITFHCQLQFYNFPQGKTTIT